jgi:hypothetical protein
VHRQDDYVHLQDPRPPPLNIADPDLQIRSAASKRLDHVAPGIGVRLRYTYDFGDNWEHDILIEDITAAEPGTAYPRCLTGRRACPPEDCGIR